MQQRAHRLLNERLRLSPANNGPSNPRNDNLTGLGITFPREKWPEIKKRQEFTKTGVYILVGYQEDDGLPTL